ncbi:hypothetical protein LQG66_05590 [Bradyrhizobium ontarionense]|uniref:Uncharacterized protein n=1 Tax=Bradyrhizobium ontarionense TaxID=2898149 RepID=A0ABY3RED1_9BRAD|nr:hypothetical protein [Bradyrhizobium sp. A19]UFZ05785.1 hypothetical protein LQG66_05590 [Bradyrhizobium sp. A19]
MIRFSARWKKVTLGIYVIGVIAFGLWMLWNIYDNGGFSRSHTPVDFLVAAELNFALILLWPLVLILLLLFWLGLLLR